MLNFDVTSWNISPSVLLCHGHVRTYSVLHLYFRCVPGSGTLSSDTEDIIWKLYALRLLYRDLCPCAHMHSERSEFVYVSLQATSN
jgi:hypothetical protein